MNASLPNATPGPAGGLRVFGWRRLRFVTLVALPFGLLLSVSSETATWIWLLRAEWVALAALAAYGIGERWPERRPPRPPRLARWVLQLLLIVTVIPLAAWTAYVATTGELAFWHTQRRIVGFVSLTFLGVLFAPWIALAAMVRAREALAREQALAFQLERSELERQALDARLHLMQAQVAPHFLFNTLANIRALVTSGSPRAGEVLESLIAYLRAAVPRLDDAGATLAEELQLVRAYLDLMHMRMPDRLQYSLHTDEAARALRCPPMTLLTLVENAVRHGVDPAEQGGRIDISVSLSGARCIARVVDTGVGLGARRDGAGTGLATLRERLRLAFHGDAQLRLSAVVPHGTCAEVEFPAERGRP